MEIVNWKRGLDGMLSCKLKHNSAVHIGVNSETPYDKQYTNYPGPQGQKGTAILNDPNWRITKAVDAIKEDLVKNPLKKGEQFNLSGYSTGSVIMAQAALMLANGGTSIDNLILIGTSIKEDSDLYKELKNNPNIKNIIRIDIDGDNVQEGLGALPSFLIEGDEHPHFKFAFGEDAKNNTEELTNDLIDKGVK